MREIKCMLKQVFFKMPIYTEDEVTGTECKKSVRFLSWETGEVRNLEEAIQACDKVDICQLDCECKLRDSYYFYLNEIHKEYN